MSESERANISNMLEHFTPKGSLVRSEEASVGQRPSPARSHISEESQAIIERQQRELDI
jgi:hypothetical protein